MNSSSPTASSCWRLRHNECIAHTFKHIVPHHAKRNCSSRLRILWGRCSKGGRAPKGAAEVQRPGRENYRVRTDGRVQMRFWWLHPSDPPASSSLRMQALELAARRTSCSASFAAAGGHSSMNADGSESHIETRRTAPRPLVCLGQRCHALIGRNSSALFWTNNSAKR